MERFMGMTVERIIARRAGRSLRRPDARRPVQGKV
jgi:hypothetical protein